MILHETAVWSSKIYSVIFFFFLKHSKFQILFNVNKASHIFMHKNPHSLSLELHGDSD